MAHFLLAQDGLFVGSSSAMNCVGAVRVARRIMRERRERSGGEGKGGVGEVDS